MANNSRIEVLDGMRGVAALAVAWFHFTNGSKLFDGWLKASGYYGWLGVEAFFVISGFVIPYSMLRAGYRGLSDAGTFILKRLIRLEPPYLISLLLTIGLLYASSLAPGFKGGPPDITPERVLLHLGYINVFFGEDWFNPVYWTLAIEFQFYVSMILLFPLLGSPSLLRRGAALAGMAALALTLKDANFIFPYLGLFGLGALAFHVRAGFIGPRLFTLGAAMMGAVTLSALGPAQAGVGIATAVAAAFANPRPVRAFAFLGAISYSVYLLHVPVGGRIMNLAGRLPTAWHGPALLLAVLASVCGAYALYRLVERPSQDFSKRLQYRNTATGSPSGGPESAIPGR